MAKTSRPAVVSRKQQSRVEKERQQRRIVLIVTITVAVAVFLILGYGLLDTFYLQNIRPVATVDGEKITLEQFQARARFDRFQLIQNTIQLAQYQQLFQADPNSANYFTSQIQLNVSRLNDPNQLGNQVIDELINEAIIRREAQKLGITVTDEEIEKAFQEAFGFFPAGTPTLAPTATPFSTATYSAQQLTLAPYTATPTETPTPEQIETTETPSETPLPTATTGPTSTPFPTPTAMTEEGFKTGLENYLTTLKTEAQIDEKTFREIVRSSLLYEKVFEAITKDVPTEDEWVWARHILVATPEEAAVVVEALKNGGDFAQLAAQFSTDTSNKDRGGDLGWFERGQMVSEFENAVFAMTEIGQISEPVQTQFGYHIIQLLGKERRPVSESRLSTLKQQKFDSWLEETKANLKIERDTNWVNKVPTVPTLPPGLGF